MGDKSSIEWTDATWNPIRGCSRVSEGCRNCYAERTAIRHEASSYAGLVKSTSNGPRWTGEVRFVEEALGLPRRWLKPRRIFVNSMSDLFHEKVEDDWLHRIFHVMEHAPQHVFQILTKRPKRMQEYLAWRYGKDDEHPCGRIPSRHIWLGVSVEDQATADERIPLLLATTAAVRWVSYEPALGPVDFNALCRPWSPTGATTRLITRLRWIVVGGESGPGARPFDLAWARSTIAQGRAAGVPVFVKQLGARPIVADTDFGQLGAYVREALDGSNEVRFHDRKGGDWSEWPEDLRVREYPR